MDRFRLVQRLPSYADFNVSALKLSASTVRAGEILHVTVQLKNLSSVAGTEVVQCYTHQQAGSTSRPVRELKAFRKVTVAPNAAASVELDVPADQLSYWSPALHRTVLEPGTFDLWVGTDSDAPLHTTFKITGGIK